MRRVLATLVLAVGVAACGTVQAEQVELSTIPDQHCCWLSYSIFDVVADPISGTPINKATGQPFTWAEGFTAWRVGTETEVRDADGNLVLRTGGRYRTMPTMPNGAIGQVEACFLCELGGGPM